MTTYYVRADGTVSAADKHLAVSETSSSTSLSMQEFNLCSFLPGDTIYFSHLGGDFTSTGTLSSVAACMHIPSSGTVDAIITYSGSDNNNNNKPTINLSGLNARGINLFNINYVIVQNINIIGDGNNGCCVAMGTTGTADAGYTVKIKNVAVESNTTGTTGGDGFDLKDSAQVEFYNISATNCKSSDLGSDQCISFHSTSKGRVYGAVFTDSNYAYVGIASTECYMTDCVISGITMAVLSTSDGSNSCIIDNSSIDITTTEGLISLAGTYPLYSIQNSTINIAGGKLNYSSKGETSIINCIMNYNTGNLTGLWANGGKLILQNNIININDSIGASYLLKSEAVGSSFIFENNIVNININCPTKHFITIKKGIGNINYNIFNNINNVLDCIWINSNNQNNVNILHNTVINSTPAGTFINNDYTGTETTIITIKNNIYYNIFNCVDGTNKTEIDYNFYYNSSNEGGAHSQVFDPLVNSDGSLIPTSPCIDAGVVIAGVNDGSQTDIWGYPIFGHAPNIGASQQYGYGTAEGTLTFKWKAGFNDADVSGNLNILSFDGTTTSAISYDADNNLIKITDGTNTASKALTVVADTEYTIQATWGLVSGSPKMAIAVDGTAGTQADFTGTFNPSDIYFGLENEELQYICKNPDGHDLTVLKAATWL